MYEFRTSVLREGPPVLEASPSMQYTFRSLYGYPTSTANHIKATGHTRGLKGKVVFSDELIIDCDTTEDADFIERELGRRDYAFSRWTTGNRGCHFHLPTTHMEGTAVVWSHIIWLKEAGLWDHIDSSIYKEGGQIRVPGAVHLKTGRVKELMYNVKGTLLDIPIKTPPPLPSIVVEEGSEEARNEYRRNLMYRRTEGGRHLHMYILWERGKKAGIPVDIIKDDVMWWNNGFAFPPHPQYIVENKLKGFR